MQRSPWSWPLVAVLVLLAAALRLPGLDYLLPMVVEPDPHISVQVRLIESEHPDPNSVDDWAKYPLIPAILTAATSDPSPAPAADAPLHEHLRAASDEVLRVRRTIAWLSLFLVPATFLLARRFVSDGWALLAAALGASCHLAIHFATQARPHGGAAPWPALTVWACLLLLERASLGRYLLLSLFGGLAVGTLQSSVALGFPVLAAHLLAERGLLSKRHAKLLVPLLALGLAFWVAYPFFFNSPPVEVEDQKLQQGGHKVMLNLFNGKGFGILGWSLWSWDPALALGSGLGLALGLVALLRRRLAPAGWRPLLVVLAYLLPMGLVLGAYERSYERFLLPMMPFFAVWTAWACAQLAGRARLLGVLPAALLVIGSSAVAARLVQVRQAPTTPQLAADWIAENVPSARADAPGLPVWLLRPLALPVYKTGESDRLDEADKPMRGKRQLNWSSYQRDELAEQRPGPAYHVRFMPLKGKGMLNQMHADTPAYLRRLGRRGWAINEVHDLGRVHKGPLALTAGLREHFELLATFRPDGAESTIPHPLTYQEETHTPLFHRAWRMLTAERFGPVLEVFALGPIPPKAGAGQGR